MNRPLPLVKQPIRILAGEVVLVQFRPPLHQAKSPGDQIQPLAACGKGCRVMPVNESTSSRARLGFLTALVVVPVVRSLVQGWREPVSGYCLPDLVA